MIDFEITENGLLLNLHCVLWSAHDEAFNGLQQQSKPPEFTVEILDKKVSLDKFILKIVGDQETRFTLLMGKNFINNYQSDDLAYWQEEETLLGNGQNLFDLVIGGGFERLDSIYDVETQGYYVQVIYPIMLNFQSAEERDEIISSNEYLGWINRRLLGNAKFTWINSPASIESFVVGIASNNATVAQLEGLAPFAARLKSLIHGHEQTLHKPLEYLVSKKEGCYVMPLISLSKFSQAMFHMEIDEIMSVYMNYLRNFFYLSDMLNVMGYTVSVIQGTVAQLNSGFSEYELTHEVNPNVTLPALSEEILFSAGTNVDPLKSNSNGYSKNVLISHPKVGRFGLVSTFYDDKEVPIWKRLYFPTNRQGYQQLTLLTEKIDKLILTDNRYTLEQMELFDHQPKDLYQLLSMPN